MYNKYLEKVALNKSETFATDLQKARNRVKLDNYMTGSKQKVPRSITEVGRVRAQTQTLAELDTQSHLFKLRNIGDAVASSTRFDKETTRSAISNSRSLIRERRDPLEVPLKTRLHEARLDRLVKETSEEAAIFEKAREARKVPISNRFLSVIKKHPYATGLAALGVGGAGYAGYALSKKEE